MCSREDAGDDIAVNAAVVAVVSDGVTVSSSLPVPASLLSSVPCTCTVLTGATLAVGLVVADAATKVSSSSASSVSGGGRNPSNVGQRVLLVV
jgi:hypothetical protein